jgi:hypothetical protein
MQWDSFTIAIHQNKLHDQSPPWETRRLSAAQEITPFMQPEGSLPCSQLSATWSYAELR